MPSARPSIGASPLKKLNISAMSRSVTKMQKGISNFMFVLSTTMGKNRAVSPSIPSTLKMLEPTTFPIAMSALPFAAPMTLTTNSGMDVPMPTIAAPITNSDILSRFAIETEPLTSQSAPNIMPKNETAIIMYSIIL